MEAPVSGSIILAGVLLKLGGVWSITYCSCFGEFFLFKALLLIYVGVIIDIIKYSNEPSVSSAL